MAEQVEYVMVPMPVCRCDRCRRKQAARVGTLPPDPCAWCERPAVTDRYDARYGRIRLCGDHADESDRADWYDEDRGDVCAGCRFRFGGQVGPDLLCDDCAGRAAG